MYKIYKYFFTLSSNNNLLDIIRFTTFVRIHLKIVFKMISSKVIV